MRVLRTPDQRFEDLPGYPFAPHYVDVPAGDGDPDGDPTIRLHYVDEGPGTDDRPGPSGDRGRAPETIVLLHGEPSWSYLYRTMIPVLIAAGHQVVAPDLVGFGRSDKPAARTDYTYARHVEWLRAALFDHLDLSDITLLCQDWGGLLGLRLVAEHPGRFRRVVAANTGLPTGDEKATEAFLQWQRFSQDVPQMPVGMIVNGGSLSTLPPEVVAAYDAPFPDETFKEGARQFPLLVPTTPDDPAAADNRRAWEALRSFDRPFLCAFSDGDPITRGADRVFREQVPGAAGQPHVTIAGGGHFLQEDKGPDLAAVLADFIAATPTV